MLFISLMLFISNRCDRFDRCRSCRSCCFYSISRYFQSYFDVVINIYNTKYFFQNLLFRWIKFFIMFKFFVFFNLHRFRTQFLYQRVQQKNVKMRLYFYCVCQNMICVVYCFFNKYNTYIKIIKLCDFVLFDNDWAKLNVKY